MGVGRDVVAADELDLLGRDLEMGVRGADLVVVIDLQPVPFPGPRFGDDMQERQMALRAVWKMDMVGHDVLSPKALL
jgi:hypothetical protein